MSDYVLTVPKEIVDRAQAIADRDARSVDAVLIGYLSRLTPQEAILDADEEAEIAAMKWLSDDLLWTLAREKVSAEVDEEMQSLMDKNSLDTISDEEYVRLEELVEKGDRITLRKGVAMALLAERGFELSEFAPWRSE